MGVRGLQWFLEHCCREASQVVDIRQLINEYRRESGNRNEELIIVVDGSSVIRILYGDLPWIGGGQIKEFGQRALNFVEAFSRLGVRLVFYFDGPTIERKRRTWVERRLKSLDKIYFILDEISRGKPSDTIDRRQYFQLPPGLGQMSRVIFQMMCGCEVFQSLTECDEEIAEYVRRNRVFAILSQDSDFVILDVGQAYYLSIENLNLDEMTTKYYDRFALADRLRIDPTHLPMLATLIGNDIIPSSDLEGFHCQITHAPRINFAKLFPSVARFIQSLHLDRRHGYMHDDELFSYISQTVFGDYSRSRDIKASLLSYSNERRQDDRNQNPNRRDRWSNLLREAKRRHINNEAPTMVYAIMSGLPYESSTSIEDFRKQDIPSYAQATQFLRQRVYGILLQEKPLPRGQQKHLVAEWCMDGPDSLEEAKYVTAEPPHPRHPGLLALWDGSRRYLNERWRLFVHSISPRLDVQRVRNTLPPHLVLPTLILYFINERYRCLELWEIDALLATAAVLRHYDAQRLSGLPSDPLLSRGVRVANLMMRSTFALYFLMAACGHPIDLEQCAPWLFFDGKLFQLKYRQSQQSYPSMCASQLCENKMDVLEDFNRARQIVFNEY